MRNAPAITVNEVNKYFGSHHVLTDILYGGKGAGKPTLMRIICGLVKPSSGKVALHSKHQMLSPALIMNALSGYAPKNDLILGSIIFLTGSILMIFFSIAVFSRQDELNYSE